VEFLAFIIRSGIQIFSLRQWLACPAPQASTLETVDLAHEHKRAYAAGT
jgi:hypothetical protein